MILKKILLVVIIMFAVIIAAHAQQYRLHGKVTNSKLEPLSFVTVQIKGDQIGTRTNDNGEYEFKLEEGDYELIFSLIGYEKKIIKFIHQKKDVAQNIILAENPNSLGEVTISNFRKDRAEELIKNVIDRKDNITKAASSYSTNIYIRATQENETTLKKKKKVKTTDSAALAAYEKMLDNMSMVEVLLKLNYVYPNKIKEIREGVKKRGNTEGLFYLSSTEGDFSLYNNLIKIPSLSQVPMLSPLSYSGLVAYKYKTTRITKIGDATLYTIHFSPGKLGNALIEGDVKIIDTSWAVIESNFTFPKFHMPEYDYFEVNQTYDFVNDKAYLPVRQEFSYLTKSGNEKSSGKTVAIYEDYKIDTVFAKKYFNNELSATSLEAYEKDSTFWNTIRKEPLSEKEVQFISRNDSVYRATHSQQYYDSIDADENKITLKKIFLFGIQHYNREKERRLFFSPVITIFRPLLPGGMRFGYGVGMNKEYKNKKKLNINLDGSYGVRNKDLIGDVRIYRLYNPFSRGYFSINGGRKFDLIFFGDAYINLLRRSNFYLKDNIEVEHGVELYNGLVLRSTLEFARRRPLSSLTLSNAADSLFKESTFFNQPVNFTAYNAFFAMVSLEYTPFQKYIREPREKITLGSNYPTFYVKWRKGIPGIFNSEIDFDYVEFGIKQKIKLGLAGISQFRIYSGDFINQKNLRYIDYKFISRGNPGLFNNPMQSFQALDSTFPVFRRFYEGHYLHQFNGAILNKIPIIKKLNLLEVAGGSLLYLPERNLRFAEGYVGLEKIIRIWKERFKIGYYFVFSAANKYNNPYQFKIGIDQYDKRKNSWNQ